MDNPKTTPEEKLLNFIEHPQAIKPKQLVLPGRRTLDLHTLILQLKQIWEKRAALGFSLPLVNKGLLGLCLLFSLTALVGFFQDQSRTYKRLNELQGDEDARGVNPQGKSIALLTTNLDQGLARAETRNIFSFTMPRAQTSVENAADLLSDQKLVGIIWSSNPQAIIENAKDGKTSLFGVGEVSGRLQIKKIFRDKILVEVDGQEMELR